MSSIPRGWLIGGAAGGAGLPVVLVVVWVVIFGRGREPVPTAGPISPPSPAAPAEPPPPAEPAPAPTTAWPRAVAQLPEWLLPDPTFDIREFWVTVPPEENAAPRYLEALYEFSPQLEIGFAPEVREKRTPEIKARWERSQALQKQWFAANHAARKPAERDAVLRDHEPAFQALAAAQKYPRCVFDIGLDYAGHVPLFQAVRELNRLAKLQAERDLERGDAEAILHLVNLLLRFSRDLRPRAPADLQCLADGVEEVCMEDLVQTLLKSPKLTAAQCDQVLASLTQHETEVKALDPVTTGLRGDYLFLRVVLQELQERSGEFAAARFNQAFGATNETLGQAALSAFSDNLGLLQVRVPDRRLLIQNVLDPLLVLATPENFACEATWLAEWYRLQVSIMGQSEAARGLAERKALGEAAAFLAEASPPELAKVQTLAAGRNTALLAPTLQTIARGQLGLESLQASYLLSRTRLEGYRTLTALRRWYFSHGEPPPDLATLFAGTNAPELPRDYYGDGRLRLKTFTAETTIPREYGGGDDVKIPAGKTVVYSVGPDGNDDQALKDWLFSEGGGDVIFSLDTVFSRP